jgi:hypothetical protein
LGFLGLGFLGLVFFTAEAVDEALTGLESDSESSWLSASFASCCFRKRTALPDGAGSVGLEGQSILLEDGR